MTFHDFKAAYNDRYKQTVTYLNDDGEKVKGLLISDVWYGWTKTPYVNVNNFDTRVPLANLIGLTTTMKTW